MRYTFRRLAPIFSVVLAYNVSIPALATTLTVTNTNDTGVGSLRGALDFAVSGDVIEFASGVSGTIELGSGLAATQSVDIIGPNSDTVVLDGQSTVQILTIAPSVTMNISNLTFANGKAASLGGAIENSGSLTVTRSHFVTNAAGDGGGIDAAPGSQLNVDECAFDGNSTTDVGGGALLLRSTASIMNSTFTNNTAPQNGGAINVQSSGNAALTNLTFSGNKSNGLAGAVSNVGTVVVSDSTFSANQGSSGSAFATGPSTVTLNNNVFADNPSTSPPGALFGPVTASFNLFFDNTAGGIEDDQNGYGTSNFIVAAVEPLLPLGTFGGPTRTMQPALDGAAICGGLIALLPQGLVRDQRGYSRTNGNCLDVGAVQTDVIFRDGFEGN